MSLGEALCWIHPLSSHKRRRSKVPTAKLSPEGRHLTLVTGITGPLAAARPPPPPPPTR